MAKRIEHIFDDSGIELKRCSVCEEWLPLEAFNQCKTKWDKLQSKCKICHSKHGCQYAKDNPEKNSESSKKSQKKRREERPEEIREYKRIYNANKRAINFSFRHKQNIRNLTNQAIARGELVRPDNCELCGYPSERIQAHHISYDIADILNVTFLCVACHVSVHQQLKLENPMFEDDDIDQKETQDLVADNVVELHRA